MDPLIYLANLGSPLMWFGACHLIVLNGLFGWIEGTWIARRLKQPTSRWVPPMFFANYVSAWIGVPLMPRLFEAILGGVGGSEWAYALLATVLLLPLANLVLTAAIEGVIVATVSALTKGPVVPSVRAFLVVQCFTYVPVVLVYALTSELSAATQLRWRDSVAVVSDVEPPVWVYFLTPDSRSVMRCRGDGSQREHVADLDKDALDRHEFRFGSTSGLYAAPTDWDSTVISGDDCALRVRGPGHFVDDIVVVSQLPGRAGLFLPEYKEQAGRAARELDRFDWAFGVNEVSSGGENRRNPRYAFTLVPWTILTCAPDFRAGLLTAVGMVRFRNPTLVEGRFFVAELTSEGLAPLIVLMDIQSREATVIATGWAPVVVLKTSESSEGDRPQESLDESTSDAPPPSRAGP